MTEIETINFTDGLGFAGSYTINQLSDGMFSVVPTADSDEVLGLFPTEDAARLFVADMIHEEKMHP